MPSENFRDPAPHYIEDRRKLINGRAGLVLAPATVREVSLILTRANAARIPVVPYAGGTGLVGGHVSDADPAPIILSMERMTRLRAIDPLASVIEVEAGAILADVQVAAREAGFLFPLSLASEGSARIGGLLATNAGGVNVIRYGNARDLCLGLEAVLPDGTIHHGLKTLRKDNLGYDLRHLLIGAEGTLGVITAASLRLFPEPRDRAAAFLTTPSPATALELLALARAHLGEVVSAFELVARQSLDFLDEAALPIHQPFGAARPDWTCLIEIGLSQGQSASDALLSLFEAAEAQGLTHDGVISQSETQRAEFWALREAIPEANARIGAISSHDISIPIAAIPDFIAEAPGTLTDLGALRINCFGHLGDGNLHYNVYPPQGGARADFLHLREAVKTRIHDLVHRYGGSVSAEHGVGRVKAGDMERYGDPGLLSAMRAIKAALDPNGIMNPGAVLRRN